MLGINPDGNSRLRGYVRQPFKNALLSQLPAFRELQSSPSGEPLPSAQQAAASSYDAAHTHTNTIITAHMATRAFRSQRRYLHCDGLPYMHFNPPPSNMKTSVITDDAKFARSVIPRCLQDASCRLNTSASIRKTHTSEYALRTIARQRYVQTFRIVSVTINTLTRASVEQHVNWLMHIWNICSSSLYSLVKPVHESGLRLLPVLSRYGGYDHTHAHTSQRDLITLHSSCMGNIHAKHTSTHAAATRLRRLVAQASDAAAPRTMIHQARDMSGST